MNYIRTVIQFGQLQSNPMVLGITLIQIILLLLQQHYQSMKQVLSIFITLLTCVVHCVDKKQLILLSTTFQGKWKVFHEDQKQLYPPFSKLQGTQGIATIYFTDLQKKSDQVEAVQIWFLMPKYYDQKVLKILIQFQQINKNQQTQHWQGNSTYKYNLYQNSMLSEQGTLNLSYFIDSSLMVLQLDQRFSVSVSYKVKSVSPNTSFIFAAFAFIVLMIVRRKDKLQDTHIAHQNIPIILSVILTFLVSISQLIIGVRSLFGIMSPEAFFTVTGVVNLWVCYEVAKFYWPIIAEKQVWILALWVLSSVYIWILLFLRHNYIILTLNSLIILPQIGYHCLKGKKIQRDTRFIIFVVSSQLYVLYFKACPNNIFRQSPSELISYSIPSFLFISILILIGQIEYGSRFFIPSFVLPSQYNYYDKNHVKQMGKKPIQCHICLQEIRLQGDLKRKIMVTPCKHIFHADCLQNWMVVQMKCPVDRSDLPAF